MSVNFTVEGHSKPDSVFLQPGHPWKLFPAQMPWSSMFHMMGLHGENAMEKHITEKSFGETGSREEFAYGCFIQAL